MDRNDMLDAILKEKLESNFVKNDATIEEAPVLAALITAASKMSRVVETTAAEEVVTDQLLDLYQKADSQEVTQLVGMSSSFIKNNTGYSVDVDDYAAAIKAYQAEKQKYDDLYNRILSRAQLKQKEGKVQNR